MGDRCLQVDRKSPLLEFHFQLSKKAEQIRFVEACITDEFILCLDIHQQLYGHGSVETNVNKGTVGNGKLHGDIVVGVIGDGQDDE
jgi:hypothetical protein